MEKTPADNEIRTIDTFKSKSEYQIKPVTNVSDFKENFEIIVRETEMELSNSVTINLRPEKIEFVFEKDNLNENSFKKQESLNEKAPKKKFDGRKFSSAYSNRNEDQMNESKQQLSKRNVRKQENPKEINFDDFIGIEIGAHEKTDNLYRIMFHTSEFTEKWEKAWNKSKRSIISHKFYFPSLDKLQSFRVTVMTSWWNWAQKKYGSGIQDHMQPTDTLESKDEDSELKCFEKKMLFIINPRGGKGKAVEQYDSVERYLASAGIIATTILTMYHKHALDLIRDMPKEELMKYYAVINVGGDGILHEVLNGYYARADHKTFKLRVGSMLGGSACGLAFAACREWKCGKDQESCIYVLTRARFQRLNITKYITNGSIPVIYGVMMNTFGFIADVDFNSEKFRYLGDARFLFYGYFKLIKPEKRTAKISWTIEKTDHDHRENYNNEQIQNLFNTPLTNNCKTIEDKIYCSVFITSPILNEDLCITDELWINSDHGYMWIAHKKFGYVNFLKNLMAMETKKLHECKKVILDKTMAFRIELIENKTYNSKNSPLDIDGERYDGTKVQGEIIDSDVLFIS